MSGDHSRRGLEDALAIGALLAPEGGAAYLAAMRYSGWADGSDAGAGEPAPDGSVLGRTASVEPTSDRVAYTLPDTIHLITPRRVANMHPTLLGVRFELVLTKPSVSSASTTSVATVWRCS